MTDNFERRLNNYNWIEGDMDVDNYGNTFRDTEKETSEEENVERDPVIGSCPVCGSPVLESPRAFYCDAPQCRFIMWKNHMFLTSKGKELDAAMAKDLLRTRKTYVRDFISRKTKKDYSAWLHMDLMPNGKIYYSLEFTDNAD